MNCTAFASDQPAPHTPGLTKELVRLHAAEMYRNKMEREKLTREDWLLAELEVVQQMQATEVFFATEAWPK